MSWHHPLEFIFNFMMDNGPILGPVPMGFKDTADLSYHFPTHQFFGQTLKVLGTLSGLV